MGQAESQPNSTAATAARVTPPITTTPRISDPRYLEIAVSESIDCGADQIYSEDDKTVRVMQASERDTKIETTDPGQWYAGRLWKRYLPVGDLDLTRPVYALYKTNRII